jgi:hypothetical protein
MELSLTLRSLPGLTVAESQPRQSAIRDWPLMGDILSARGGVPEHLIRWRRAEGADDPRPQDF